MSKLEEIRAAAERLLAILPSNDLDLDALDDRDRDALAVVTFVRDLLATGRLTDARVEYRCNRNEGVSGQVVDLASHFPNAADATRWAGRLGTGARSCDALTRIVHTLAVEVEACESRPEQGSGEVGR